MINMRTVAGLDLCDDVSQISVSITKEEEVSVTTIPVALGSEKYCIPTCALKKKNRNEWVFGEEAEKSVKGEGFLIKGLLSLALKRESITIEGEDYDTVSILARFIKVMIKKISFRSDWREKAALFLTVQNLDAPTIRVLQKAIGELELKNMDIRFLSHSESFFYYSASQPEELRIHKVCLLDYDGEVLRTSVLSTNRLMKPAVTTIEEREFELPEKNDQELLNICREVMDSEIISSIYLAGQGFEGNWEKETIRYLCLKRRRVFQGMNLYTKGACYAGLDLTGEKKITENEIYLDKDKLKSNIGMDLFSGGQVRYRSLIEGGINWFDAKAELEVLLGHEKEIRIIITPITGEGERCVVIRAEKIPERPERSSRVRLDLSMLSPELMLCRIRDLGFGEIFPSTGNVIEEEIPVPAI